MSRSMIDANTSVFAQLARAGGSLLSPALVAQKRAIATDEMEKGWLKEMTLQTMPYLNLGPSSKLALGAFQDSLYLVAIGFELDNPPLDFEPVSLNAGMFTAIVSELGVPIVRSTDLEQRLLEYVFYPVANGVEVMDSAVVRPFFTTLQVFRVDHASALLCDEAAAFRAAIAAVLGSTVATPLAWPDSSRERIDDMIRDPAERAPFHLLLRALTESREDAAFLAIYRCVEQLFPVPKIAELSAELSLDRPALQLAATIERQLGWRRREDDAIAQLFGELAPGLVERIADIVGAGVAADSGAKAVSKRVYELRNQCVHFRPVHAEVGLPNHPSWLSLADLLLEAVQNLYARYASAFDAVRSNDSPA
jgi:hypothetical protein